MTTKAHKRDLRTRVTAATFEQIRRYAAAHGITQYAAAERLVLQGLDASNTTADTDEATKTALAQLAAKTDVLAALMDRVLFGAMVGYAYARHVALVGSEGEPRQALDHALTQAAEGAYRRQRAKALGGDHDAA